MKKYLYISSITAAVILLLPLIVPVLLIALIVSACSPVFRIRLLTGVLKLRVWFHTRYVYYSSAPFCLVADKLEEVTVANFIECADNGKYEVLVIAGRANKTVCINGWNSIISAYGDSISSPSSKRYLELNRDLIRSEIRLNWIKFICEELAGNYQEVLIKELRRYGYNRPFTKETIAKDIKWVLSAESRTESIYNDAKNKLNKEFGQGGKRSISSSIYHNIREIRRYAGYQEAPRALAAKWTMADYIEELNDYNRHVEAMNKMYQDYNNKNKAHEQQRSR